MPLRTIKLNKHKHKKSLWVTNGIIKSIKKRDKLYAKLKTTTQGSSEYDIHKTNLKTYNRILRQSIKSAK